MLFGCGLDYSSSREHWQLLSDLLQSRNEDHVQHLVICVKENREIFPFASQDTLALTLQNVESPFLPATTLG